LGINEVATNITELAIIKNSKTPTEPIDYQSPDVLERVKNRQREFNMATENDIVLIYLEENPLVFARIESILPDSKPDWYHVKLLMLQIPLQVVTWILRDVYINGETFTMNGKAMRFECIESPESEEEQPQEKPPSKEKLKMVLDQKVISLKDFKKE
jgi:hypothetical protein